MLDVLFPIIFIISIIAGIVEGIRTFQALKRPGSFSQHLSKLGIKVSVLPATEVQPWMERLRPERWSEGILRVEDSSIDYIFVDFMFGGEGADLRTLDCFVKSTNWPDPKSLTRTRLVKKRRLLFIGRVQDVEWKGDQSLADLLNRDFALKQKLISDPDVNRDFQVAISPIPEYGHYQIRVATINFFSKSSLFILPTRDFFETLDLIGRHLRTRS